MALFLSFNQSLYTTNSKTKLNRHYFYFTVIHNRRLSMCSQKNKYQRFVNLTILQKTLVNVFVRVIFHKLVVHITLKCISL